MPLQFFLGLEMVTDQSQIDILFSLGNKFFRLFVYYKCRRLFEFKNFFFTLDDILTLKYLYRDCLLEVKSIVKIGTFDKTIESCFNLILFSTLIYI